MAKMFPEEARYHRPDSEAERRLYPVLAGLPDDYAVYCNRRWHTPRRGGTPPKPAEADFLIAHPDHGILVVEVKGGLIRYDPKTDSWFSNAVTLGGFKSTPAIEVVFKITESDSPSTAE